MNNLSFDEILNLFNENKDKLINNIKNKNKTKDNQISLNLSEINLDNLSNEIISSSKLENKNKSKNKNKKNTTSNSNSNNSNLDSNHNATNSAF